MKISSQMIQNVIKCKRGHPCILANSPLYSLDFKYGRTHCFLLFSLCFRKVKYLDAGESNKYSICITESIFKGKKKKKKGEKKKENLISNLSKPNFLFSVISATYLPLPRTMYFIVPTN
uniref:Uncharacterized protein n=1 Tax=Cacopsylla melanoneura TaxID=428564 RepID=A0A8D9A6J9_9HEMI